MLPIGKLPFSAAKTCAGAHTHMKWRPWAQTPTLEMLVSMGLDSFTSLVEPHIPFLQDKSHANDKSCVREIR